MIVPHYYEDLHMLHENTMPDRSYYMPASVRMDCLIEEREKSDRIQMLNGSWKFKFYDSIYDLKDLFFDIGYNTDSFEEVPVPGVWQNYGYDNHQYTNIRYPFPVDPPYVPQENPCAAYVHHFAYQKDENAPKAFLEFEGVDSCFYLWLNGKYIGYSQVSHALSEFDVTSVIEDGDNTLAVLVLKWCDGSYLEDQDKFRMSGIFRDVYLLKRPEQCIYDYFIHTSIAEGKATVSIETKYLDATIPVKTFVYDAEGNLVTSFVYEGETCFEIEQTKLWNSEQPYLYTLVLETEHEVITEYVGIREIRIEGNVVYVNGAPIKFRGVNRHDSDPVTGLQYLPDKGLFYDETKNKSSHRTIKVPASAVLSLKRFREWQKKNCLKLGRILNQCDPVFANEEGKPMHPDSLTSWFSSFIKTTNLPQIHIHSLRHTNATLQIANGVSVTTVAGQLGHSNANTTTKVYAHAIQSAAASADMMDSLLNPQKKQA